MKTKYYPLTRICKDDILESMQSKDDYLKIRDRVETLTDKDMEQLASKMSESYLNNHYWSDIYDYFMMMFYKEKA